eukprot:gene20127-24139_t
MAAMMAAGIARPSQARRALRVAKTHITTQGGRHDGFGTGHGQAYRQQHGEQRGQHVAADDGGHAARGHAEAR